MRHRPSGWSAFAPGPGRSSTGPADRQRGAATIEFVLLSVLLLVPFVYLLLTVAEVQRAAFAVSSASREAGRAFVTSADEPAAHARAEVAADLVLRSQGVDGAELEIRCAAEPCLAAGRRVTAVVSARVELPLVPALGDFDLSVRVRASHVVLVDEYRGFD